MQITSSTRPAQRWKCSLAALALITLAGGVTACSTASSGESKEYKVPSTLCGTPVSGELLSPFLPSGGSVSSKTEGTAGTGIKRCEITVDEKPALTAATEWREKGERPSDVALDHKRVDMTDYESTGTYLFSGTGAVGRVDGCNNPSFKGDLFTVIETQVDSDDKVAMKKLITAYNEATRNTGDCGAR
ncbi:hypothetical protein ABZY19_36225 [Streptomyces sp. NPDC006475]|uniref:hypothetical protein n=1 Tax=Streptomyces sp. NPDC006475 TaxID=3155719 RepID=UPI0033BC48E5